MLQPIRRQDLNISKSNNIGDLSFKDLGIIIEYCSSCGLPLANDEFVVCYHCDIRGQHDTAYHTANTISSTEENAI